MGLKNFFEEIKKGVREGIEKLDEKTLTNNVVNNIVGKVHDKLFGDMVASETQAEIEYEYTNYYIDQLLDEMEDLALDAAKYSIICSEFNATETSDLTTEASKIAKDLENSTRAITRRIVKIVNSEVDEKNQRAVLEKIYTEIDKLAIKCEVAINQAKIVETNLDSRESEVNKNVYCQLAEDGYKKAFYEKADEAQVLEDQLPAIELRLRQR